MNNIKNINFKYIIFIYFTPISLLYLFYFIYIQLILFKYIITIFHIHFK